MPKKEKSIDVEQLVKDIITLETANVIFIRDKCIAILADRKSTLEATQKDTQEKLSEINNATK